LLKRYTQRENRLIRNEKIAFLLLPLVLIPLLFEVTLLWFNHEWFALHREGILIANVLYIVIARFSMLDTAVYIFSSSKSHVHLALVQIVLLYLEVTLITIFYYAIVFDIFDVFSLFHLNSQ